MNLDYNEYVIIDSNKLTVFHLIRFKDEVLFNYIKDVYPYGYGPSRLDVFLARSLLEYQTRVLVKVILHKYRKIIRVLTLCP